MSTQPGSPLRSPASFSAALLPELLVGRGWLSAEQIAEAMAEQRQSVVSGQLWTPAKGDYALGLTSLPDGETALIQLPGDRSRPPDWKATEWVPWGTGFVALFDANTCEHIQDIENFGESVGLAVIGDRSFVHTPTLWAQGWAAHSNTLLHDRIPLKGLGHLPLDLTWGHRRLYLSDRGAGIVHGVDAGDGRYLGYVAVRPAGSKKALHVAPLPDGKRFYVTDNQSAAVWVADATKWRVKRQPLSYGSLGNLALSADGQWLFALAIKPGPALELLILEARNLVLRHAVPLRGEPFSQVDDPCDLLALSPNGQYLVAMTYVNRPKLLTPLVTVIDLEGPEVVFEYTLDEESKPTNLAWWAPHPQPVPSLVDIIADKGWVDRVALANLQVEMMGPPVTILSEAPSPVVEEIVIGPDPAAEPFPVLDQYVVDPALLGAFPEKALRAYTFLPLSQEGSTLTVAVVDAANEKLEALFEAALKDLEIVRVAISQKEFDRFLDERYPIILAKYQAIVSRHAPPAVAEPPAPPKRRQPHPILAAADPVLVDELIVQALTPLVPADKLDDALPELFEEAARIREVLTTEARTAIQLQRWGISHDVTQRWLIEAVSPPGTVLPEDTASPSAPAALPPGVVAQPRSIASPDQLANLPPQTVLLCDAEMRRVVELGPTGETVWQADRYSADLAEPRCASRLASGNTLISDGDRVIEVTRNGNIFTEIGGPELRFLRPHRSTRLLNGHTLVADRGHHRVIELDENGKVVWQYGFAGSLGITEGRLYSPSDLQRLPNGNTLICDSDNHRVIEVDGDDKIVWQYGNAANKLGQGQGLGDGQLDTPVSAWRFGNGNTLIVDAGNRRAVEVTTDGRPIWISNIPAEGGKPIWAWRLQDFQTIIATERFVFQVAPTGEPVGFLEFNQLLPPNPPEYLGPDSPMEAGPSPRLDRLVKQTAQSYIRANRGELGPLAVVLIDRARNRLFEVNRHKQIVWRVDEPASPLDLRLQRPQMAELIGTERVLITDTDHHRVIEIQKGTKEIIWQYGKQGVMGSGPGQLGHPRGANLTAADTVLIADGYSGRVVEVDRNGEAIWTFGGWDDDLEGLTSPYYAQRLADGNTLITDWSSHQVMEVDPEGVLVWRYGKPRQPGSEPGQVMYPEMAIRLPIGTTLICDTRNSRVLEVDPEGNVVWQYGPDGEKPLSAPTQVMRLDTGHTVIIHSNQRQILEVNPLGEVVWQYALPADRRHT